MLLLQVNFGEVFIPANLEVPKPRVLPEFKRLAHGLRSGNISVLDAKTFYIPNLHYDGAGPDAYFWVGNGTEPSPLGIKVPSEMGRWVQCYRLSRSVWLVLSGTDGKAITRSAEQGCRQPRRDWPRDTMLGFDTVFDSGLSATFRWKMRLCSGDELRARWRWSNSGKEMGRSCRRRHWMSPAVT